MVYLGGEPAEDINRTFLVDVFCQVINEEVQLWLNTVVFSAFEDREKIKKLKRE